MEQENKVQVIHLSDYWNVIKKRKGLITSFLVITVFATAVASVLMTPIYEASSRMAVEKETSTSPITGDRVDFENYQSQMLNFNTHFALIKSKPVIKNLLADLEKAGHDTEELEAGGLKGIIKALLAQVKDGVKNIKANIKTLLNIEQHELTEQEELDLLVAELQKKVVISNVRDTRLLAIKVLDASPEMAALLANMLAKKYIEFDLATRLDSDNQNLEWLNKEVYSLKKRLEDDERKFYEYKQKNKVFSLEGKQKVIDQKITELNNEFLLTKTRRQEIEAKLGEISKQMKDGADIGYLRSILDNSSIDNIYSNLTSLELEKSRLGKVFKGKHPKILQVTEEIDKVRSKLKVELNKEIENLRVQKTILQNREEVMEDNLGEFEQDALDTSSQELTYTILQRNMDTSQKLYDTLVTKVKESGVISSGASSNIRIVEMASVPMSPVKPNKAKNVLLALILGLFGGVGLAFFLEYIDQSFRTEEDVENFLGLPVLSVIPMADKSEGGDYF
ncbi:GumC family protein [Desulforhopalus sp. 52FAK]